MATLYKQTESVTWRKNNKHINYEKNHDTFCDKVSSNIVGRVVAKRVK